ncbi:MAG: flavin reductase [Mariniphaga sp.]|jgi:flavin reductase (DIM6/NTAB) family NADH-FMN oxidoreductase RutF|nr:flavin reductase [Mariniphaga sp.]
MKKITKAEIQQMDKIYRLNLINSLAGYKSANLIGTKSNNGITNLSIFSSVIHLGSNPALLGFILRPATVPRHTFSNIKETGFYTINHVHKNFVDKAHFTSAKFAEEISEFEACFLTEEYLDHFYAPFLKESRLKMGMKYLEEYEIKANNTILLVGEIQSVYLPEEILKNDGDLNLNLIKDVCISGLNNYHEVTQLAYFNYARPGQKPVNQFKKIQTR